MGHKKSRVEELNKALTAPFSGDKEEEVNEKLPDEEENFSKTQRKGLPIPKQAVNFDDKWIRENIKDEKIAGLLKSKRTADAAGDKITARKIRRALRESGFYVSKNREE